MNKRTFFRNIGLVISILVISLFSPVIYLSSQKKQSTPKYDYTLKVDSIDQLLSTMSLEEKVGMMFLARTPEFNQIEDIQTYHLGGYILFGRDMEGQNLESLTERLLSYQEAASIPLVIASDEEGGRVTRISTILEEPFQSPQKLYASGGIDEIISDANQKVELLENVGITAGLFPVADYATDSEAFIYDRTLGQDLDTTCQYVAKLVENLSAQNFASTLKHFPGYGNNGDSHSDIISDDRSLKDLQENDLKVFQAGIDAGADSVLVSHNIMTQIDSVPSSISEKVISILRNDLHFNGVIMTDDTDMEGLNQFAKSQEEAAYLAIKAGEDMILSSTYASQIPYIIEKVQVGDLTEERINESVKRILIWKEKLGLIYIS